MNSPALSLNIFLRAAYARVLIPVGGLVFHFAAVRYLNGSDAGRFVYWYSVCLVASVLTDFGLRHSVYASFDRLGSRGGYTNALSALYVVWATGIVISLGVFWLVAELASSEQVSAVEFVAYWAISATMPQADIAMQALVGMRNGRLVARLVKLQVILLVIGVFLLSGLGILSFLSLGMMLAAVQLLRFVAGFMTAHRHAVEAETALQDRRLRPPLEFIREALDPWAGLTTLSMVFFSRIPVVLGALFVRGADLAFIGLALMVVQKGDLIAGLVAHGIFPQLQETAEKYRVRVYMCGLGWVTLVGVVGGLLFMVSLPAMIEVLIGETTTVSSSLRILAVAFPLIIIHQYCRFALAAENRSRGLFRITLLGNAIVIAGISLLSLLDLPADRATVVFSCTYVGSLGLMAAASYLNMKSVHVCNIDDAQK